MAGLSAVFCPCAAPKTCRSAWISTLMFWQNIDSNLGFKKCFSYILTSLRNIEANRTPLFWQFPAWRTKGMLGGTITHGGCVQSNFYAWTNWSSLNEHSLIFHRMTYSEMSGFFVLHYLKRALFFIKKYFLHLKQHPCFSTIEGHMPWASILMTFSLTLVSSEPKQQPRRLSQWKWQIAMLLLQKLRLIYGRLRWFAHSAAYTALNTEN